MALARAGWLSRSTAILVAFAVSICSCSAQFSVDSNLEDEIGLSTSEVLRLRGYLAIDHIVPTQDGYALNLVEARSPLIDYDNNPDLVNKEPVLFIHGTLFNATCFINDTPKPASPKDYSCYNASQMSREDIEALYRGSPNAESLVLMLVDFGHRVFLMNRRNTLASLKAYATYYNKKDEGPLYEVVSAASSLFDPLGLLDPIRSYIEALAKTFDPIFWNFSLDEAAEYDLPAAVDFVLRRARRRTLAAVGWSAGGAIIEMGLVVNPELNQKISKSLLWSPSLYLGRTYRNALIYTLFSPLLNFYIGPILPQFFYNIFSLFASQVCSTEIAQRFICQAVEDMIAGHGGDQQVLKPGFLNTFPASTSSHELAHLGQLSTYDQPRYYSFGPILNLAKYGSIVPPIYDVSKITSKGLYFWSAPYDALVSMNDVERNVRDLSVEAKLIKMDQPGVVFQHSSFIWHKRKFQLLYIQCLKILES